MDKSIKELYYGIFTEQELEQKIANGEILFFKAKRPVLIGTQAMLKVNMNIGVSDKSKHDTEIKKLTEISKLPFRPDSMMDHTIVPLEKPLWKSMIETFDGAVGTLPHYLPFDEDNGMPPPS